MLDNIKDQLEAQFPDAQFVRHNADDPNGFQFLDITREGVDPVYVEWKAFEGFGISSGDSVPFSPPDFFFTDEDDVFRKISSLLNPPV